MKIWLDGKIVDESEARLSVFDHGTLYGDGVFEGIRIYNGKIFECGAHVDRLFESAELIRLVIPYSKPEIVTALWDSTLANEVQNGYIRLVVTRGAGTLGLNPFLCEKPSVFVIANTIQLYPKEMYDNGMAVIIAKTVRCSADMINPRVKSLNYLNNILAKIEAVDAGVLEAIMLNVNGNVAECTGDNIFIVKDSTVMTPPTSAGILHGISRGLVLKLANELGMKTVEEDFKPEDIFKADECFLTGTAAEVIPVTKVNEKPVGSGKVGAVTMKLFNAFHDYIRRTTK